MCTSPLRGPKEQQMLLEVGESLACLGTKVNRPGVRGGGVGTSEEARPYTRGTYLIGLTKVLAQHLAQRRPRKREL